MINSWPLAGALVAEKIVSWKVTDPELVIWPEKQQGRLFEC